MLHVVLISPQIPPNTGNVIRLCANTGARLHLVEPLGFPLDDAKMRRAGLDYHEFATMQVHPDWAHARAALAPRRMFALTTRASRNLFDVSFQDEDVLIFGSETSGIPEAVRADFDSEHALRLPMQPQNRSLNLSNAVAVSVFEAWRQLGFR